MGGAGLAIVAAAMLAGQAAGEASSCQLTYSGGPVIAEALRGRGFAFATYDHLCAAARQHGLILTLSGTRGVQGGRAFGWVVVSTRRAATGASSTREHLSTSLDENATESAATDLLYESINDAANNVFGEIDDHLRSIEAEEARLRATPRQ